MVEVFIVTLATLLTSRTRLSCVKNKNGDGLLFHVSSVSVWELN